MSNRGKLTRNRSVEGYADSTVKNRIGYIDEFYRWVWDRRGRYTTQVSHEDGDEYLNKLLLEDHTGSYKSNVQKTLKMYYRWREHQFDDDEWEPSITFSGSGQSQPRDYLSREERALIREASLDYDSIPHYNSVTPEERERWKAILAQRERIPTSEVTQEHWKQANGFKIASMVCASLDLGLRPGEVGQARTSWVDVGNSTIRIPEDDAVKSRDNYSCAIKHDTAEMLDRWLDERMEYEKYDDTDRLWLTRENGPYGSTTLKRLLRKLCDEVGIDYEDRKMTWYTIRHSVGTFMTREDGLKAASAQLRHQSIRTTAKYDQVPVEDRRDSLDKMG